MKNLAAVLFCIGLCISIALLYPQVGTSNPGVDDGLCLECHSIGDLHGAHDGLGCDACHSTEEGGGPVSGESCLVCHGELCELVEVHGDACLDCHEICEVEPTDCEIDVIPDSLSKSHWEVNPTVFRIETIGIEDLTAMTPVTIECDADGESPLFKSVFKTGKVVLPNFGTNTTVIWQTALIWPAWWTQSLNLESETCTVTVGDCTATDTFELEYRFIFGIPLGN